MKIPYKILVLDSNKEISNENTIQVKDLPNECNILAVHRINPANMELISIKYCTFKYPNVYHYYLIQPNKIPIKIEIEDRTNTISIDEITTDMDIVVFKNGKRWSYIYYDVINEQWYQDGISNEYLRNIIKGYNLPSTELEFRVIKIV